MQEEAERKQEAVGGVGGGRGQRGHGVDTVSPPSEAGCPAPRPSHSWLTMRR